MLEKGGPGIIVCLHIYVATRTSPCLCTHAPIPHSILKLAECVPSFPDQQVPRITQPVCERAFGLCGILGLNSLKRYRLIGIGIPNIYICQTLIPAIRRFLMNRFFGFRRGLRMLQNHFHMFVRNLTNAK